MLHDPHSDFAVHVWRIARTTGLSAPVIANAIMNQMFQDSMAVTEREGCDRMLRAGVIAAVKDVIKERDKDDETIDFAEIEESFQPLVEKLGKRAYYVPKIGAHLRVPELIDDPVLLDNARKYMRLKGDECHAEADRLDDLYEAVIANRDKPE